ncbi:hypothetical protein KM043_004182 [Ampulex compressa]|nr:hypothetical protein KM043_004182 [Ampulex compressa]
MEMTEERPWERDSETPVSLEPRFSRHPGQKSRPVGTEDYVVTPAKLTRGPSRLSVDTVVRSPSYLTSPSSITAIAPDSNDYIRVDTIEDGRSSNIPTLQLWRAVRA